MAGARFSNPTTPFPPIRSAITLKSIQPRNANTINTFQIGLDPRTLPDTVFRVGKKGSLIIGAHVNVLSAVNVKGSLTLKSGAWISARKGCSVQGQPGSSIAINNATVDTTDGCGIGVTNAKLTANNLKFSGSNTTFQRPTVGIQCNNSTLTVTNSQIADAQVGIAAQNGSTVALANTTFPGVTQPVTAGSGSVVTDPATIPPAPAPAGDPAQPGIVCNDIDTNPTCAPQDPPPAIGPPPADGSATVPGDQPPANGTSTSGGATGTGSDSTQPDPLEGPGTGSPDGTTGTEQEADLPLSDDIPPVNSNSSGQL